MQHSFEGFSHSAKSILKRPVERLAAAIAPRIWRMQKSSLLVLMYHRVLPVGDPRLTDEQPGMYVYPETLHMHLRTLKRHFDIVHLGKWVSATLNDEPTPKRACAITFDDGWRDNYEFAFPLLLAEQTPATIFVVSDMVGTNYTFWPEQLAEVVRRGVGMHGYGLYSIPSFTWLNRLGVLLPSTSGEVTAHSLDKIISHSKQLHDNDIRSKLKDMSDALEMSDYHHGHALADWNQLIEMANTGIVAIGSHTRRHTRLLSDLDSKTLYDEVVHSKKLLAEKLGCNVDLFCYPNGDASPEAMVLVAQHYLAACSTLRGWHQQHSNVHMIHRIGIHQDITSDETSFLARLSGWI